MNNFENQIRQDLKEEPLRAPSKEAEQRMINFIDKHYATNYIKSTKNRWLPWGVVASVLAITLYVNTNVLESVVHKSEFDMALESSIQIERTISELEHTKVTPLIFMEINKLNSQIIKIDQDIQSLIVTDFDASEAVKLVYERIDKLNLVKSLYSSGYNSLRI